MAHLKILNKNKTALVIVDFQEAFRQTIPDFTEISSNLSKIVKAFRILNLPVIVTEQYPKGLGRTAAEILEILPSHFNCIEKTAFSSCGTSEFTEKLDATNTKQVLLCGLETHICVNQTAHDLLNEGFDVNILTDGVGSRTPENKETGLSKMKMSGVVPSCVEMALFELMRDSKHENFKEIQDLIK
jgi:nicotinamidase-related amidase